MKRMIHLFSIIVFLIGGCTLPPKSLNPVARKNVENARVLRSNTETFGAIALKTMDAVTRIAVIQRERKVTASLFPYIHEEDRVSGKIV